MNLTQITDLFEALTILCFGLSWPISIRKSWVSRTAKGKSLAFLVCIFTGYIAGIISKLSNPDYMAAFSSKWYVLFFYVLNFVMVSADIFLYFRNKKLDKEREAANG